MKDWRDGLRFPIGNDFLFKKPEPEKTDAEVRADIEGFRVALDALLGEQEEVQP